MDDYSDNPLAPIVGHWLQKIQLAWDYKKKHFQDDADDMMRFYNGPYDFMYRPEYSAKSRGFLYHGDSEFPAPSFRMTVNKAAEMVQIYGPVLYHRNPIRQANPRKVPMLPHEFYLAVGGEQALQQHFQTEHIEVERQRAVDMARGMLMEHYLSYTPEALGLKKESRRAINEALIKGMGVLWHELYRPPGAPFQFAGSFFDSVDNLVIDPDMETLEDAKWIARRYIKPAWQVEAEYGLPPGSVKPHMGSSDAWATKIIDPDGGYKDKQGQSNDLVCYWRIYSKMGLGTYLKGVPSDLMGQLEYFGPYVHLAVCEGCPYFLNLPPHIMAQYGPEEVVDYLQWPTPFWADDGWPMTPFYFHEVSRQVWPMSHLKPALGELKFLNWAYSFMACKIRTASRDFIAVLKSAGEEIKQILLKGTDYTLIEIERAHGTINDVVQFLKHPDFHSDIYKVIEAIEYNFERRTGLTELMYGETPFQMRSASEAQIKGDALRVRPDDMANKVEDAMSDVARREAILARWHLTGQDVAPVLGQQGAMWWEQLVMASDPSTIIHQLEYRIEAGSARKPNKERDAQNMKEAMQALFTPLWGFAMQTGNIGPANALLEAWAKTMDMDVEKFLIPQPPPPPEIPQGQEQASEQANGQASGQANGRVSAGVY